MSTTCLKCNKEFKTKQTLQRHLDRKNPCDLVHKCNRCDKIFDKKSNLITHLNRKTPCKLPEEVLEKKREAKEHADKILLLKEEKIKNETLKIELEEKKLQEREKERLQREKEHLQREKEKEQYYEMEERRLELKEHEHENKLKEIELKGEIKKEVELIRNQRKEMTVQNINNINNGNINTNINNGIINNNTLMLQFMDDIRKSYPPDGKFTIHSEHFKKHIQFMGDSLRGDDSDISKETGADMVYENNLMNIFHNYTNVHDMFEHYIKFCFANKKNKQRGIFFSESLKKYYVYKEQMLTGVNYLDDIQPVIYDTIGEFIYAMQGSMQFVMNHLRDKRKQGKLTNADYVIINKFNELIVFINTYEDDESLQDRVENIFKEDIMLFKDEMEVINTTHKLLT
jgi:uncharacterized C2H2 Zn-finger protein